jgi:hypothetical protein
VRGSPTTWIQQELAVELLREVSRRCGAASIPFLPVKGVVTARLLYEDVAEREMLDVDLRIRPQDFDRFRRVAREAGWRCVTVSRIYRNLGYEFPGLPLEVEAGIGPPGLCALTVEAMQRRASPFVFAPGLSLLAPEIHDHAVVLVVNVFKDKMTAAFPRAVADVERIALKPSFSVETFVERALESRVTTIAWLVAGWLESRGSAPWGAVRALLERRARVRRPYAHLFRRLLPRADRNPLALRILARVGGDTPMMQARALATALAWELETLLR